MTKAERKAAEKGAQEEETRRLKGKKRREMERELKALKKELGEDGVDWEGLEKVLDGEWDEVEWDRVVNSMLERKAINDEGKPEWDDDIEEAAYDKVEEERDGELSQPTIGDEEEEDTFNMVSLNTSKQLHSLTPHTGCGFHRTRCTNKEAEEGQEGETTGHSCRRRCHLDNCTKSGEDSRYDAGIPRP